jgi:hypothetical protein
VGGSIARTCGLGRASGACTPASSHMRTADVPVPSTTTHGSFWKPRFPAVLRCAASDDMDAPGERHTTSSPVVGGEMRVRAQCLAPCAVQVPQAARVRVASADLVGAASPAQPHHNHTSHALAPHCTGEAQTERLTRTLGVLLAAGDGGQQLRGGVHGEARQVGDGAQRREM